MNKLYEELAEAINDLNQLKYDACYDEMDDSGRLELKIKSIEAKLLSLQYRDIVGQLYTSLLVTKRQEKEARSNLFREDGVTKKT